MFSDLEQQDPNDSLQFTSADAARLIIKRFVVPHSRCHIRFVNVLSEIDSHAYSAICLLKTRDIQNLHSLLSFCVRVTILFFRANENFQFFASAPRYVINVFNPFPPPLTLFRKLEKKKVHIYCHISFD